MLKKIQRQRKGKEGWDVIRTKVILDHFSKLDHIIVNDVRYLLFGILGKGGYSCVFRLTQSTGSLCIYFFI